MTMFTNRAPLFYGSTATPNWTPNWAAPGFPLSGTSSGTQDPGGDSIFLSVPAVVLKHDAPGSMGAPKAEVPTPAAPASATPETILVVHGDMFVLEGGEQHPAFEPLTPDAAIVRI